MRELSEMECFTASQFVLEALSLHEWSAEYYEDWMYLQGKRSGAICLCFVKASKNGTGRSKKLLKFFAATTASAEAAVADFKAALASLKISLNRKTIIDETLVDLNKNGY